MSKALLFIDGEPPKDFPSLSDYSIVACTDGAFRYLKAKKFPFGKLDFVSGDFDSLAERKEEFQDILFIETPDQNKTDFHKALEILKSKGISEVDVYGGSGGEQDHYLGNLTVAYLFREELKITFYDEFSKYFFIPAYFEADHVKGRMISLVPFPYATKVMTTGLNWPLNGEDLDITYRVGTRNFATENKMTCSYSEGGMLIFIGNESSLK